MAATFPMVIALIVCKVVSGGAPDPNAGMTHWDNLQWDLSGGKYHCRRIEMNVTSVAEQQGQQSPPWTPEACMRAAMTVGPNWDAQNGGSGYRFRWAACPTPIHASKDPSSAIVGWKIPECPYKDNTVECEQDSVI